jgi:FkbM family methyltransferase
MQKDIWLRFYKPMSKKVLQSILCRVPSVYGAYLSLRRPFNAEKKVYLKLVKRGSVVIEVGANLGYFTRLFGDLVGPNGRVIAFEPVPQTREQLLVRVGDLSWITVLPYAVSDVVGEFSMYIPGKIHGQASLRRHCDLGWSSYELVSSVNVQCMPLVMIDQIKDLEKIDFIKVDVEGAELQVLKGARDILARDHPILHLEIEERWMKSFGYGVREVELFLRSIGYSHFASYEKNWIALESLQNITDTNVVCAVEAFRV